MQITLDHIKFNLFCNYFEKISKNCEKFIIEFTKEFLKMKYKEISVYIKIRKISLKKKKKKKILIFSKNLKLIKN